MAGNESFISKEFLPVLGVIDLKHITVSIGHDNTIMVYFEEVGFYNSSMKKECDIKAKQLESFDDGIKWIDEGERKKKGYSFAAPH